MRMRYGRAWLVAAALTLSGTAHAGPEAAARIQAQVERCFELRESRADEAVRIARATLAEPTLESDDEIKLLTCLARAAALLGDSDTTSTAIDRVEALLAESPRPPEFALRALTNAGAALQLAGDVPRALALYMRAFEVAEAGESDVAQVKLLNNVGSIQSEELEAFETAEAIFARAQAIADTRGLREPVLAYNRALNHMRMGRTTAARAGFDLAAANAVITDQRIVEQRARAERIALDGDVDVIPALQALADAQRDGDPSGAAMTLLRMSALALAGDDGEAAYLHARAAVDATRGGDFRVEYRDALRAEVAALRALGRFEAALDTQQVLRDVEVGALRSQNLGTLAGLQARLQDRHSASELALLREQRQIEALNQQHARRLRGAGFAGLAMLMVFALAFAWYQRRVNRRLHRISSIDSMTRLLNRGAATRAMRTLPPATGAGRHVVFLLDVDHFKHSNDRHGHGIGDAILTEIAARLTACCRPDDLVARWGGEEFLIACASLDLQRACDIAERVRLAIAARPFVFDGVEATMTVSIGFADWPSAAGVEHGKRWRAAVDLADRALYASKRGGRDAWTGLWCGPANADPGRILHDPQAAVDAGTVHAVSSRAPIQWHSDTTLESSASRAAPPLDGPHVPATR